MGDHGLNPAQHEAVHTLSGPLLVLAGAGSGKTRVITYRIAELIKSGILPHRILAVTFTNKAAREMKERAMGLLGRRRKDESVPEISTFHALCVRVLRRHARRLGYPEKFAIYDRGDQESVARQALREIRVSQDRLRPQDLLNQIGWYKNQSLSPGQALAAADGERLGLAALAYEKYQAALKASGAMDFDDLLMLTETLFDLHAEARYAEASRFDHLLIDEYQDTNGPQYRIVKALAARHRNLCVVGDDDQSIYGWRGAEVTHILSFGKDWPEAKLIKLEDNYRSRAPILELANTLIAHNRSRHQKVLRAYRQGGDDPRFARFDDETLEAQAVVHEIRRRLEAETADRIRPCDVAILFRTNEQPRAFELELRRARVPYVLVGGQSFYDRKEVRDVLAYLRVLANPSDEISLLRILNVPPRGIGTGSVQTLVDAAVRRGEPLWNVLPEAPRLEALPSNVADRVEAFRRLIDGFRARLAGLSLAVLARELLDTVNYRAELERAYPTAADAEARWASVEELVNAIAQYEAGTPAATIHGFLEETVLAREDPREDSGKDERQANAVTLMTLHSAKGLEFPHVYMVGMEEGILPHARSVADGDVAEERRLCYVGVTRAQETLTLTMAKTRMKWGRAIASIPSRFVLEMRGETAKAARAAQAAVERLRPQRDAGPPPGRSARPQPTARRETPTSAASTANSPSRSEQGSAPLRSMAPVPSEEDPTPALRRLVPARATPAAKRTHAAAAKRALTRKKAGAK